LIVGATAANGGGYLGVEAAAINAGLDD